MLEIPWLCTRRDKRRIIAEWSPGRMKMSGKYSCPEASQEHYSLAAWDSRNKIRVRENWEREREREKRCEEKRNLRRLKLITKLSWHEYYKIFSLLYQNIKFLKLTLFIPQSQKVNIKYKKLCKKVSETKENRNRKQKKW